MTSLVSPENTVCNARLPVNHGIKLLQNVVLIHYIDLVSIHLSPENDTFVLKKMGIDTKTY